MASTNKKILEIVLKIAGRCNINCSYCYMFNQGNTDYEDQPSYMSLETLKATTAYIKKGIEDIGITDLVIIFHGGEPMMLKPHKFESFCIHLGEQLAPHLTSLRFSIQTNAILITSDWLKLLSKYKVRIGVSLDGPEEYNDQARLDHNNKGTYSRTVTGLRLTQQAARHGIMNEPGVLCVVNPHHDGRKIYRHFVDELDLTWISLLFPLDTHDNFMPSDIAGMTDYMLGVFNEWAKDDNPNIVIRQFDYFFKFLATTPSAEAIGAPNPIVDALLNLIVPIASNGDISVDDESKPINFGQAVRNVNTSTLLEHIFSDSYQHMTAVMETMPKACQGCEWVGYCRGGAQNQQAINRFSRKNHFNNPSIFCETYKRLYGAMAKYMLDRGLDEQKLVDALYDSAKNLKFADLPAIDRTENKRFFMKINAV